MNDETMSKALKGCLMIATIILVAGLAFAAGFISGDKLASTPVAQEAPLDQQDKEPTRPLPTATLTLAPPTSTPVPATPTDAPTPSPEPTESSSPPKEPNNPVSFDLYWEIWDIIERDFYGEIPSEDERMYAAIRGTLETLDDDYTSFIEPEAAEISRNDRSGSFEGIGALVRLNDANQLEIVQPLEGQPAEQAGVKAGDIVIAVDGESIEGYGLYDAIGLIRGPKGTTVVLTIEREGESEPLEIEIERARIPLPTIEYEILENDIGYVRLYEFNSQATQRLTEALEALLEQGATGIIFDLRNNPGGFLNQSIAVADQFLPAGVVLYERGNEFERTFESTDEGLADDIPLVVLINSGSASASEIVAGAIQDRGRAPLIGETSFGKGSVQQPHVLSNGAELRVTIARWFTPNEQPIHGNGLAPNIEIPFTEEDAANDVDPQLDRAVEYLLTGE